MTELWTTAQAAQHWGVSESRARAILANAGVSRISGYDADQVRNITRPGQGARTDLKGITMSTTVTDVDIRTAVEAIIDDPAIDIDGVVDELMRTYDLVGQVPTMSFDDIDTGEYWAIVAKHDTSC